MGCNAYRRLWKPTPGTAMLQPTGCCRAVPTSPSPLPCAVPPLTAPPMPLPSWALQVTNAFHQCERDERKEKTMPFCVNVMRSQVSYRAAQACLNHPPGYAWASMVRCVKLLRNMKASSTATSCHQYDHGCSYHVF